jgi:hypothetical protein
MKKNKLLYFITFSIGIAFLIGCNTNKSRVSRAFYFWKSTFELSTNEKNILYNHQINTLYVKYFDVMWNAKLNAVVPVAKIKFKQNIPSQIQVIPVVFITNNALIKTKENQIPKLANDIAQILKSYQTVVHQNIAEIQLDCDWTLSTKEKYFHLIEHLKLQFNSSIQWSATIRLHQIKYADNTGLPPVNKGMLMYYNMGNIHSTKYNSIFNKEDAEKYAPYIKQYPLHLDAVLPVFSWLKVFRNTKLHELLNQISMEELVATQHFKKINEHTLQAIQIGHYKGYYYLTNDLIIVEKCDTKLSLQAANHLHNYFQQQSFNLALFHLDQNNLLNYATKDIETLFTSFN